MFHSHCYLKRNNILRWKKRAYCIEKRALIICFSPNLHFQNRNQTRMLRHLLHELIHIVITVESKSKRKLGDKLINLKVPVWLDEGLAEYVTYLILKKEKLITQSMEYRNQSQSQNILISVFCSNPGACFCSNAIEN